MVISSGLNDLVLEVAAALKQKNKMVVTAESCTGGMIAEVLTSLAGSTAWFDRAYVTYSYESKIEMLGVHQTTIQRNGAVSLACVEEMAVGALQSSHATLSVACSGIAGPGGGSEDKPVGTVWMSWALQGHASLMTECYHFEGDREAVRVQCTEQALKGILAIFND